MPTAIGWKGSSEPVLFETNVKGPVGESVITMSHQIVHTAQTSAYVR